MFLSLTIISKVVKIYYDLFLSSFRGKRSIEMLVKPPYGGRSECGLFPFAECAHDCSRGAVAVKGAELVAILRAALWLPVEYAAAMTVGQGSRFANYSGELTLSFKHNLRLAFVYFISGLYNHYVAAVFLTYATYVGNTVGDNFIGILAFFVLIH